MPAFGQSNFSLCDVNRDGAINVKDAQYLNSESLGQYTAAHDLANIGVVNVVAVQSEINSILFGCAYYSVVPRFAITTVTLLNQGWIPSDIPSPGNLTIRGAFSNEVTLLNDAFISADIPSPGNLTLHGAYSNEVTILNQAWISSDIPGPGNLALHGAYSNEVTILNQAWISADIPSPGNLRFAAGLLVSVNNTATGSSLMVAGARVIAAGASTVPVDLASVNDGDALLAGQTVRFRIYPPDEAFRGSDFLVNSAAMRIHAPLEVLITAPANVTAFDLSAAVYTESGRVWRTSPKHVLVLPDPGLIVTGRALRDQRTAAPATSIGARANGLIAEYFRAEQGLRSWSDLNRAPDKVAYVTAVNQPESAAFGRDPLGTGFTGDYAARFRGEILVSTSGSHDFFLNASLGARLLVDGKALIDQPPADFAPESQATVELTGGWHSIEIDSYHTVSNPGIQLSWRQPNSAREVVRPEALAAEFGPLAVAGPDGSFRLAEFPSILNPLEWHAVPADKQVRIAIDPSTSAERPIQ